MAHNLDSPKIWAVYGLYLFGSIVLFSWYDLVAITSVGRISRDGAGNIVFSYDGSPIYPFTLAAAMLGVLGTAHYVWRAVGGIKGLALGLVVGRAATLAVFEIYEFTFTGLGETFYGWSSWTINYSDKIPWFLFKASYLGVLSPWMRRKNLRITLVTLLCSVIAFLIWVVAGYKLPESGDAISYVLNAATRILFSMLPVVIIRR
ncbi:MAG: hypothetical protein QXM16_01845 [Nitrososphaerota archaeon]